MQVQRIDQHDVDAAPGQVLQVGHPVERHRLAGGHQHALAVHCQRQDAVAAGIGVGDHGGGGGHVDAGGVDAQVAGIGAGGQPFGQPLQRQIARGRRRGGQLQVGQQHQRVYLAGVARALGRETDAFQVMCGHHAIAQQGRGDVGKLQPSRGDIHRNRRYLRAMRGLLFHPKLLARTAAVRSVAILAHPLCTAQAACPRPPTFLLPSRA
ncbi:hypothetical protein D3C71_1367670 [compost metagenome]